MDHDSLSPRILSPISQGLTAERPLPVDPQAVGPLRRGSASVAITLVLVVVSLAQSHPSDLITGEALQLLGRDEGEPSPILLEDRLEAEVGAARAGQSLDRLGDGVHGHTAAAAAAARRDGRGRAGDVGLVRVDGRALRNRAGTARRLRGTRVRILEDERLRSLG